MANPPCVSTGLVLVNIMERLRLTVTCNRCRDNIPGAHYNCVGCKNYDLCLECSSKGIYCQDDTHPWVKRVVEGHQRQNLSPKYSPTWLRVNESSPDGMSDFPSVFQAKDQLSTPQELFDSEHRFINNRNPREILIFTDGACSRNGQDNPRAGCAFVYRPSAYSQNGELTHGGTISMPLEVEGPTEELHTPTSNRAELRAVIGALQFRDWSTDCNRSWRSVVIATDSEYVSIGATEWVENWERNGWRLAGKNGYRGGPVKNQDLWKLCLWEIRKLQGNGVNVSFWRIPRELNTRADEFAKRATLLEPKQKFHMVEPQGTLRIIYRELDPLDL